MPTPLAGEPTSVPGALNLNMGPPEWIKPGTRLTFYAAGAAVSQSRYQWKEVLSCAEGENSCWRDVKTGKYYVRSDVLGASDGWASGDGIYQIDVLAVEGTEIVYSQNLMGIWRIDDKNQIFTAPGASGGKAVGTVLDGAWIHPGLLAQLQEYNTDGLLILRGKYPLNGVTYQSIGFSSTGAGGSLRQYTYDLQSGTLLMATSSAKGATSPIAPPGQDPPAGKTQLFVTQFLGQRQRAIPGVNGTNPAWVASTNRLLYTGTYRKVNPVDGALLVTAPASLSVSINTRGKNWALLNVRKEIQFQGFQPVQGNSVSSSSGPFWVDTQALASLRPQQVLDEDPISKGKVEVVSVGPGARGTSVTIADRVPGIETIATYDLTTGVLVNYRQSDSQSGDIYEFALQQGP